MRFDLTDLRLFVHVVAEASVTRGAARAHMAPASASARIRGMEAALGAALLARGRRGVRPTPAGQALARHARLVLEQVERMRGDLAQYAGGFKGQLRLLCNTAALSEFVPEAVSGFLAAHPDIDLDLEERPSHETVQAIAAGDGALGIVADTVDLAGLETVPFRRDRLVLVVPRRHALARRRALALGEAATHDFVGLSPGSALQAHLGAHAARAGHSLRLRVRVAGFEAVCRLVADGIGLAVVPASAAERCRRTMALAAVRLAEPWAERRLILVARRFDALPAPMRRLARHLAGAAPAD